MKRTILSSSIALSGLMMLSACGGSPEPAPESQTAVEAEEPAPVADVAFADLTGDAAAGEKVFALCRACHVIEDGVNRVGPSLYGLVGRQAGSVEGFSYTDANKNAEAVWDQETLFEYLENPQQFMPGTRMAFPGVKDAQDRADLIAYLESNGE